MAGKAKPVGDAFTLTLPGVSARRERCSVMTARLSLLLVRHAVQGAGSVAVVFTVGLTGYGRGTMFLRKPPGW